jgi:hypothetical protein
MDGILIDLTSADTSRLPHSGTTERMRLFASLLKAEPSAMWAVSGVSFL